jgi:hypothetical protein
VEEVVAGGEWWPATAVASASDRTAVAVGRRWLLSKGKKKVEPALIGDGWWPAASGGRRREVAGDSRGGGREGMEWREKGRGLSLAPKSLCL